MNQIKNINRRMCLNGWKTISLKESFMTGLFCLAAIVTIFIGCQEKPEIIMEGDQIRSIRLPEGDGTPVLLDGIFSEGEWDDALVVAVHDSVNLLFKKYRDHIFIGIKCPQFIGPSIDVYLTTGNSRIHQFHVSAQLAERILSPDSSESEDPPYIWGLTRDWYANEFRWNEQKLQSIMASQGKTRVEAFGETVYPFDGVEIQIRHAKFPSPQWLFRIEILYPPDYRRPFIYPAGTSNTALDHWMELLIDG